MIRTCAGTLWSTCGGAYEASAEAARDKIGTLTRSDAWVDRANRIVCEQMVSPSKEGTVAAASCLSEGSYLVTDLLRLVSAAALE